MRRRSTPTARFVAEHGAQGLAGGDLGRPVPPSATASSTAATRRPGARRRCARCCATTARAAAGSAWIDLHTGLGPSGHGERIFACRDDAAAYARAKAWWGEVTSIYDGSSTSALLTGMMWLAAYEECAQAEYTGIALEYGTLPNLEVMDALRADQWLELHPEADDATRRAIKQQMRDAFYTDTDAWKEQDRRAGGRRLVRRGPRPRRRQQRLRQR